MENLLSLSGTVEDIIYHNQDNGYTVFSMSSEGDDVTVTCYAEQVAVGELVEVQGEFVSHHTYGRQFKAAVLERTLPAGAQAIRKYLASGAIKGIGPVTAQRIVELFGEKTFEIIENHPEELATVKGLSRSRAEEISLEVREIFGTRRVLAELHSLGLSAQDAVRVYMTYGSGSAEAVRTDPYMLCMQPLCLPFEQADQIASTLGFPQDDDRRISAGLRFVLEHNTLNGHTFLPKAELINVASRMLGVDPGQSAACLMEMEEAGRVICPQIGRYEAVYLEEYYRAESYIAMRLMELGEYCQPIFQKPDQEIDKLQKRNHISYAELQRNAVKSALENGALIITGGPGTGKTTILNAIIELYQAAGKKLLLAAPTGRAAKRMAEVTGREAKTIHRLLEVEYRGGQPRFLRDDANPLKADVVLIDEMSMVDALLMEALLRAISPGTRLIMTGDIDQLPAVGAGNVLKDIIHSGVVQTVRLTEIFRQAADSLIILNSHAVNRGEYPDIDTTGKDFYFIRRSSEESIARTVLELVKERIPKSFQIPSGEIQVISPTKRGTGGTYMLNKALQQCLNPPSPDKVQHAFKDLVFREGDRIMQVKNNYDLVWSSTADGESGKGLWNGDMGVITEIDNRAGFLRAQFDDRECELEFNMLDEVDMAYAVTVHKSQGSEFSAVVIPVFKGPAKLLSRNLLYTAITRARDLCVLVGDPEALRSMVDNHRVYRRFTGLQFLLAGDR